VDRLRLPAKGLQHYTRAAGRKNYIVRQRAVEYGIAVSSTRYDAKQPAKRKWRFTPFRCRVSPLTKLGG